MQAIKNVETQGSKDPYNQSGDNGDSHGAYQFNKNNYKNWATQYGVDPNDFSASAQNKVAYARIKDLKNQGLQPEEIAAKWNGAKVDQNTGKLTYVNPAYGVKFRSALQGSQATQNQQSSNPTGTETANASDGAAQNNQESILGKLVNFAFPIAGDVGADIQGKADKSPLQQLGDAGLSALWFAPGVGEGAEAAIRGAGLLGETGAKVAGQALGGVATGYASDISSKLSQGNTDAGSVLTPGIGTATGGLLGGALGKLGSKYSTDGVVNSVTDSNNAVLGNTKTGASKLEDSFSKDKNPGALLAQKGINISHEVNPDTVAYDVGTHASSLRDDANTLTDTLTEALKRVPGSTSATDLENSLINSAASKAPDKITASEQINLIKEEFSKIRSQYGKQLSPADLNELKKRAWNLSHFDAATTDLSRKTQRMIGNQLKTEVENSVDKANLPNIKGSDVKNMNEYIGQHLDAADHLVGKNGKGGLNGRKAPGGRLGDMLKSQAGTIVGGALGLPAGPAGALMGALAGHYGGKLLGKGVRFAESSPIKSAILKRMIQEDPEVVQKMIAYSKQTPQGLEAIKEQLAQKGINIFKGSTQKAKVSPRPGILDTLAKKSAKGLIVGSGARAGSAFNSQGQ